MKTTQEMYQHGDRGAMFAPLILAIDAQAKLNATPPDIDDWMFMATRDILLLTQQGNTERVRVCAYKNRMTRNYIYIDEAGQCWMKPTNIDHWYTITNGLAFDQASGVGDLVG